MSYCVHCGVKLKDYEDKCPLCFTPVVDPNRTVDPKTVEKDYPDRLDRIDPKHIKEWVGIISTLVLFIPNLVCLIIQITEHFNISWPNIVYGASMVFFLMFILPLLTRKVSIYVYLTIDFIAVSLFLMLLGFMFNGISSWYLPFALPVTFGFFLYLSLSVMIARLKKPNGYIKYAIAMFILAPLAIIFEILLAFSFYPSFMFIWSWYVFTSLVLTGVIFTIIGSSDSLRKDLERKFFI